MLPSSSLNYFILSCSQPGESRFGGNSGWGVCGMKVKKNVCSCVWKIHLELICAEGNSQISPKFLSYLYKYGATNSSEMSDRKKKVNFSLTASSTSERMSCRGSSEVPEWHHTVSERNHMWLQLFLNTRLQRDGGLIWRGRRKKYYYISLKYYHYYTFIIKTVIINGWIMWPCTLQCPVNQS